MTQQQMATMFQTMGLNLPQIPGVQFPNVSLPDSLSTSTSGIVKKDDSFEISLQLQACLAFPIRYLRWRRRREALEAVWVYCNQLDVVIPTLAGMPASLFSNPAALGTLASLAQQVTPTTTATAAAALSSMAQQQQAVNKMTAAVQPMPQTATTSAATPTLNTTVQCTKQLQDKRILQTATPRVASREKSSTPKASKVETKIENGDEQPSGTQAYAIALYTSLIGDQEAQENCEPPAKQARLENDDAPEKTDNRSPSSSPQLQVG